MRLPSVAAPAASHSTVSICGPQRFTRKGQHHCSCSFINLASRAMAACHTTGYCRKSTPRPARCGSPPYEACRIYRESIVIESAVCSDLVCGVRRRMDCPWAAGPARGISGATIAQRVSSNQTRHSAWSPARACYTHGLTAYPKGAQKAGVYFQFLDEALEMTRDPVSLQRE